MISSASDPLEPPASDATNDWEAARAIIATVAPTLARALNGPPLTYISTALALDPTTAAAQIVAALTPLTLDQLRALKAGETRFRGHMKTLNIAPQRLGGQDVAADPALAVSWFPEVFALMISVLFFVLLMCFAWHPIPAGPNETVLNVMLGAVAASFTTVVSYFFGSTRASGRKDLMLYHSKPA